MMRAGRRQGACAESAFCSACVWGWICAFGCGETGTETEGEAQGEAEAKAETETGAKGEAEAEGGRHNRAPPGPRSEGPLALHCPIGHFGRPVDAAWGRSGAAALVRLLWRGRWDVT